MKRTREKAMFAPRGRGGGGGGGEVVLEEDQIDGSDRLKGSVCCIHLSCHFK